MRRIRFYLRTLIGQYADRTGEKLTYVTLSEATGLSTNTISHLVNNKQGFVSLDVLERICAFFECELHELMRLADSSDGAPDADDHD